MKTWAALVCIIAVAGCAGPKISVVDASPRRVGFLVQNARLVPMQDIDERAASHCRQHGLQFRRTNAVWIGPTLKRVAYECGPAEPALTRKPAVSGSSPALPASADPKVVAWTKAKAAMDAWSLCLRFDAERKANETNEPSFSIAQEVVAACSALERAVHEPLQAVGEDSGRFHSDLHEQAIQNAWNTVTSLKMKASLVASGQPAF